MSKIVGSIIAAVALWAGTTAFIGSQMEENLQKQINNTNKLYADKGIQYKINNYQKSFFESTAKVEVEIVDPTLLEMAKETVKLPLVIEYNIEHGPLFFKNGLGFGAAKVHQELPISSLLTDEAKKEFLSLIKEDITITSDMIVSFLNNAHYKASTNEVKINRDEKKFHITPLEVHGDINLETLKGDSDIHIASLEFKEENSQNGLTLNNLLMKINIEEFIEKTLMVGSMDISVENLTIKDDSNPQLSNINMATDIHMVTQKDSPNTISTKIEGSVDLKDTKLPDNFPNLKTIHANMNMQGIGTKGMLEFQHATQEMQKSQSDLITKMQSNPSEEEMQKIFKELGTLQETMMRNIVHSLNTLLVKDKTLIAYGLEIETKEKKKSNASIEIGYTGNMDFNGSIEEIVMRAQQQVLNMISLDVDIGLDAEHIKSLPDAQSAIQQIQMAVAQGFAKEENGKYILKGYYKNQELIVNDNNLTASILPLLMMATQGGGF